MSYLSILIARYKLLKINLLRVMDSRATVLKVLVVLSLVVGLNADVGSPVMLDKPYSTVKLNDRYLFRYEVTATEIIILLDTSVDGYAGLGFGESMFKADIMVIQFNGTEPPRINDCTGIGERPFRRPPCNLTSTQITLLDYDVSNPK